MKRVVRVGNAQGFWGDRPGAAAEMLAQEPGLDFLTLDYLAEVSMSILARQRGRDAARGYAGDFLETLGSLAPHWANGSRVRIITNAGGLNPQSCARECARVMREACGLGRRIGIVSGDDVLAKIRSRVVEHPDDPTFDNLDDGRPMSAVLDRLVTANAYLGAAPIVSALEAGADVVVTGRVADPSLTVAACARHFGWVWNDHDRLAGATVAGHLIECGTQVTGGISTDWLTLPDPARIGYPIVEVDESGSCVVTKPRGTGGRVNERTVKEQLLYEIGDPAAYLSPDVTASFLTLGVDDCGDDRVRVSGATGRAAPPTYKVSATYRAGYRAAGSVTICGRQARLKAERCAQVVLQRLRDAGCAPRDSCVEYLGAGALLPGGEKVEDPREVVLRIAVADERRAVVERFAAELMPLVTSGPQGVTGYAEGRPRVHEVFGYWPCRIAREHVRPSVEVLEA